MEDNKCGLEVVCKDNSIECRAICLFYNPSKKCCRYCDELKECKKICGFMRNKKK
jgi:hypothetical protein